MSAPIFSRTMKLFAVLLLLSAVLGLSQTYNETSAQEISFNASVPVEGPKGVCNVRSCGCSPYRRKWCTKRNARVYARVCQRNARSCRLRCNQVWCRQGPPPPKPAPAPSPSPNPPPLKVFVILVCLSRPHTNSQDFQNDHSRRCITTGANRTTSVFKPTTPIPIMSPLATCLVSVRSSCSSRSRSRPYATATATKTSSTALTPRSTSPFTSLGSQTLFRIAVDGLQTLCGLEAMRDSYWGNCVSILSITLLNSLVFV